LHGDNDYGAMARGEIPVPLDKDIVPVAIEPAIVPMMETKAENLYS